MLLYVEVAAAVAPAKPEPKGKLCAGVVSLLD